MAGYDLYSKITPDHLEEIYSSRLRQVRVGCDDDSLTRSDLKKISDVLHVVSEVIQIALPSHRGHLSARLELDVGHTLLLHAARLRDEQFPSAREVRETMSIYLQDEFQQASERALNQVLFVTNIWCNDFSTYFVYANLLFENAENKSYFRFIVRARRIIAVKERFIIDQHPRPAFRVGWPLPVQEMSWSSFKLKEEAMPVFIQSHALQRLDERMDLQRGPMHYYVFESLHRSTYHVDEHGRILIDYVFRNVKTGYLVCSVEDKRLLIHTFLFITASGTPEGKKLSQLTGLRTLDKKYLAIDRLSTFLSYKIQDNEFVKNIFEQAGCGHLLTIEDTAPYLNKPKYSGSIETLVHYLQAVQVK